MSLLSDSMEQMVLMVKKLTPDGEGDQIEQWTDSGTFYASVTLDSSMQAKVAEKQGVTGAYSIFTKGQVTLEYHNVVRRTSDGMILRVTSRSGADTKTPGISSMDLKKVSAEEWSIN